jgi:magnesium transporter
VEDCRSDIQRAKLEEGTDYLFVILKLVLLKENNELTINDLAMFLGTDYLISVHQTALPSLAALKTRFADLRPDQGLYRVMDTVVDSYYPLVEELEDRVDTLEGEVLVQPRAAMLERVAEMRTSLLEVRRVLTNTRHVVYSIDRLESSLVGKDLAPFLRDVHDHLARDLDSVARERDRLAGVLDLYQSSVANQNNEATRLLTVLGTIALPALVISAYCGMSLRYPAWINTGHAFEEVSALVVLVTTGLLLYLWRRGYFSK